MLPQGLGGVVAVPRVSEPRRLLYDAEQGERDACGVGFIAATRGDTSRVLPMALEALKRLAHRGGGQPTKRPATEPGS